jgi:hypothetical protein
VSEPVRMVTVEVHPFDAVGIPGCAVTTDTVVIAASRVHWFADFGCLHPIARRTTPKGRPEGHPAKIQHVEFAAGAPNVRHITGKYFLLMHILASNFTPLLAYTPNDTKPENPCDRHQYSVQQKPDPHADPLDTTHANDFVAAGVETCWSRSDDCRGEIDDVFIVISEERVRR